MQTFTFNRPITLLFSLSLLLVMVMCAYGLTIEFRLSLLAMLIVTGTVLGLLFYLGFLRRLQIGEGHAVWRTPSVRHEMALADVRHFGVVKFRSFRFIYFSKAEQAPFEQAEQAVVADAETFLIQYRPKAWTLVQQSIQALHPQLQAHSFTRQ